jgi:hypothetical protein
MYHLPKELIDYIFSFDENEFHKYNYNKCINEMKFLGYRRQSIVFFSNMYEYYKIHLDASRNSRFHNPSSYILSWNKLWGNRIDRDYIDFHKVSYHKAPV